jgi:hypothetical protein
VKIVLWSELSADDWPLPQKIVTYLARGTLILADVIVLVVTWAKTYRQWRQGRQLNMPVSLSTLLLRDGEITVVLISMIETAQKIHILGTWYFVYVDNAG